MKSPLLATLLLLCPIPSAAVEAPRMAEEIPAADRERAPAFPLEGLSAENAKAVEDALQGMTRRRWACPACKAKSDWRATCDGCGEDFEQLDRGAPLLREVAVDPATGVARVAIGSAGVLTLSALERALAPAKVRVRRADIPIGEWTRIILRLDPERMQAAKQALGRPDLFAAVSARRDDSRPTVSLIVERDRRRPVTLTAIAQALGGAVRGAVFEDIAWAAPCMQCEERGLASGGCRVCWHAVFREEKSEAEDD